jgi:hypothetical protein
MAPIRARVRASALPVRAMLAFGLPTVPADASVYALQVADRWYLLRAQTGAAAGLYALAAKLATVVFVAVRGFQYAWPPLAYSVTDDDVAARLYALVTTYYVLATGVVVAGVALLGRWAVRLLLYHDYGAHDALPWLALGWALYGLYLIFVVISGRARRTRRNLPAALVGLAVNIAGCSCSCRQARHLRRRNRAGDRLRGDAPRHLLADAQRLQRRLRMGAARPAAGGARRRLGRRRAGPADLRGAAGFLLRGLAWCAIVPLLARCPASSAPPSWRGSPALVSADRGAPPRPA